MATAETANGSSAPHARLPSPAAGGNELALQWRRLTRAATFVAVLTSPALIPRLHQYNGWSTNWSVVATLLLVIVFPGFVDLVFRRLIPWPSLFGADGQRLREEDIMAGAAPGTGARSSGSRSSSEPSSQSSG